MINSLFGDIRNGRLNRMTYLVYWMLLTAFMVGVGFAIVFAIGAGEMLLGGNLAQAQDKLRGWFTLPTVVVVGLISMAVFFAHLNIIAKRVRDIGLPGWWVVLLLAILGIILSTQVSESASDTLSMIALIALLLLPGGVFERRP